MKTLTVLLIFISILTEASKSQAAKMDSETQNMVIQRVERVLGSMDQDDSSFVRTSVRLADLLSERARLRFMNEVEQGCQGCLGSTGDRKKALQMYKELLSRARRDQRGAMMFQMAHLYGMNGEELKGMALFESILKDPKTYPADIVSQARVALADLLFQKNEYKRALQLYNQAYGDLKMAHRGVLLYRIAWCQFNLGQLTLGTKSLETLAGSNTLLVKKTTQGLQADEGFRGDVLRDLATFYSRGKITNREIATFQKLSPAAERKELLFFFAEEAGRLGQKQAASQIYQIYLKDPQLTPEERLEALVLLAQANYDQGQTAQSTRDFTLAAEAFKKINCKDESKCPEIQAKMKRYVTEVHRSKKLKPDLDVLKTYAVYAKTFPTDTEMAIRGAQVGIQIDQPAMAVIFYRQAARAAQDLKLREQSLLGEIESAEAARDPKLREQAYHHYLELSPRGPKTFEVRYQLAHLSYERKDFAKAALDFRVLALDKAGTMELRKKAADLALDSLAFQKRDREIESWAAEFAQIFPAARTEYAEISRKATINQVAQTTNDQDSSKSELRAALAKMQTLSLKGRSDSERRIHFRNQELLARKIGDEKALMASFAGLLALKTLDADEREEILARKAGALERRLEFKPAYETALQMKFPKLSKAERELRLGTLADLAGAPAQKHYEASLKLGLGGNAALSVRSRLVLLSSNPVKELGRQKSELQKDPSLYGQTVIQVAGKTRNLKALESHFASESLRATPVAILLKSQPLYLRGPSLSERLSKHRMKISSDRAVAASTQTRVALLKEADQFLDEAVRLNDFTAKVLALSTVNRENLRMVKDLSVLPMPAGLKREEQLEYQDLLKAQSRPFLVKAKLAEQQLKSMWDNESLLDNIQQDFEKSRAEIRPLLAPRIRILAELAPGWSRRLSLDGDLKESLPSREDLLSARQNLREDPDNRQAIEKLKTLETKIGHPLMSSYLEARLGQLQKEKM